MVSSNPSKTSSSQVQRCLSAVLVLFFVLFCLGGSSAFAACHAVTPSGSGSKTGSDWNDAYAASRNAHAGRHLLLCQRKLPKLHFQPSRLGNYDGRVSQGTELRLWRILLSFDWSRMEREHDGLVSGCICQHW